MSSKRRIRRQQQRTCLKKKAYHSQVLAFEVLRKRRGDTPGEMNVYLCKLPRNGMTRPHWHIGHTPYKVRMARIRRSIQ